MNQRKSLFKVTCCTNLTTLTRRIELADWVTAGGATTTSGTGTGTCTGTGKGTGAWAGPLLKLIWLGIDQVADGWAAGQVSRTI